MSYTSWEIFYRLTVIVVGINGDNSELTKSLLNRINSPRRRKEGVILFL
jgi:hypothetical protein